MEDIKDSEDVEAVAANIVDAIAEPLIVDHNRMRCTASIGIALYPDDGTSMDELKRNADHAMYRAKQSGRNTYCAYSRTLSDTLARRRQVQNHLREALERDGFEMYYQPQYTPAGMLIGIEALVRFRDAELKHISPGEFIPMAEETGLMNEVGSRILLLVCKQMETWRTQGLGETVISVNISAIQLERSTFARDVSQLLKEHGIRPSSLQLEITETAMMSHVEECRRQLAEIEKLGVGLSLDDFGTGHSSLSYIHRLPVNTIKIDRSFVQRLPQSDESIAIIRAIIAMASALNLKVVAEGVETQAQLRAVEKLGCDGIQGYLFSKPLDTAGVTTLLSTQAARYDETATQLHVV